MLQTVCIEPYASARFETAVVVSNTARV